MEAGKAFDKAVRDYGMLAEGDKVLVGASGGKDSAALAYMLAESMKTGRIDFSATAVHVSGGGVPPTSEAKVAALRRVYSAIGMELLIIEAQEDACADACYRCASLRRAALMCFAVDRGFGKIALGHHLDDILTTALMELVERGRPGAMVPVRRYPEFGVTLIRPLAYVPEESLRRLSSARGWETWTCECPALADGMRSEYRRRLEALTSSNLQAKRRLFKGLGYGELDTAGESVQRADAR